jgi:16S rRNA (cytidine1402-2'-O)-methyltransferase
MPYPSREQTEGDRLAAGLYVVGTPIGNLDDVSPRALRILGAVDGVLAEDTRHTRKLFARFDLHTPLISCHRFNEAQREEQVLRRIEAGAALALVSDAGMPGVSDPGARVVAACRAAGLPVVVVPGPSAVTAAIALSGFGGAGFLFEGFLPHKSGARRKRLAALLGGDQPVVLFESPFRAMKLLDELAELAPDRPVFAGRELTKKFEQSLTGLPREIRAAFEGRSTKGEWVFVIDGPGRRAPGEVA